jgi:hypothetical protein
VSHFTKLKTQIKSIDAFIAACAELGLTQVSRNAEIVDFYGKKIIADVSVKCGDRYDVALVRNGNAYDLTADFWAIRRTGKFPKQQTNEELQNRFLQLTTKHDVIANARRQGLRVASATEDEEGNVVLNLAS